LIELVKLLLSGYSRKFDSHAWSESAYRNAAKNGHTAVVELFLRDSEYGIYPDLFAKRNNALVWAGFNGFLETTKVIVEEEVAWIIQHNRCNRSEALYKLRHDINKTIGGFRENNKVRNGNQRPLVCEYLKSLLPKH
jgi:hypothetical protein